MILEQIQYITRDDENFSHSQQAEIMFEQGIKLVQLRMKNASRDEIVEESQKAILYANRFNSRVIINDSVEIAKEVNAHGVHLGLNDMPVDEARNVLGKDIIIGGTANTVEHVFFQIKKGVDYVGMGPFKYTLTKENLSPIIGLHGYSEIVDQLKQRKIKIPVFAVGGIALNDIKELQKVGIKHVAISKGLWDKYKPIELYKRN